VEDWGEEREEVGGWEAEGGFGGDSGLGSVRLGWSAVGWMVGGHGNGTYLFTF
jgi:hypothetical protein